MKMAILVPPVFLIIAAREDQQGGWELAFLPTRAQNLMAQSTKTRSTPLPARFIHSLIRNLSPSSCAPNKGGGGREGGRREWEEEGLLSKAVKGEGGLHSYQSSMRCGDGEQKALRDGGTMLSEPNSSYALPYAFNP